VVSSQTIQTQIFSNINVIKIIYLSSQGSAYL